MYRLIYLKTLITINIKNDCSQFNAKTVPKHKLGSVI